MKSNNILNIELNLYDLCYGKVCEKCNHKQGFSKNGFEEYYCIHYRNEISKLVKPLANNLLKNKLKELKNKIGGNG